MFSVPSLSLAAKSATAGWYHYTLEEMATLLDSSLANGHHNGERQAIIHALLKHGAHLDGAHELIQTQGGLHPTYAEMSRSEMVKASPCRRL